MGRATPAKPIFLCLVVQGLVLGLTQVAWAVQSHGRAEGLVAHQLGHILFACGLVVVFLIGRREQWSRTGWSSFRWFLLLAVAWCALTFTGHFLDSRVDPLKFVRTGDALRHFQASTFTDWVYYLSRLDHLLWVPALAALLRALVLWERPAGGAS